MPIIGRLIRKLAEGMIHSEGKHRNPLRADGHFGQAIPLEDAKIIISELAAEPIIKNYCMCRWIHREIKKHAASSSGSYPAS